MADDLEPVASPTLDGLLDELVLAVLTFLPAPSLVAVQRTCHHLGGLAGDGTIWRSLCAARWQNKPRYRLTAARERWLDVHLPLPWKDRFAFFERDARRQHLHPSELVTNRWHFNFTPQAGGRGRETLQLVHFRDDEPKPMLHMQGYPPLPYHLSCKSQPSLPGQPVEAPGVKAQWGPPTREQALMDDLIDAPSAGASPEVQVLYIANFPAHQVSRRESDWEWLIVNENVTLVSAGPEGDVSFDERGFQTPLTCPTPLGHS